MKQKFYEKDWFMWLMLVLFTPVGIFLMWKYKRFSDKTRKILTGVFVVWFLFNVMGGTDESNDKNQQIKATNIEQEQKVNKDTKQDEKLGIKLEDATAKKRGGS